MTDHEEYRQKAEECRSQAGRASRPQDKAAWLKMAADWLNLAQLVRQRRNGRQPRASNDDEPAKSRARAGTERRSGT